MRNMKFWAALIVAVPAMAFAAAEGGESAGSFRAINPAIDTWAAGTVSNVDLKTGDVTFNGATLPYATTHAQMRQELRSKLSGVQGKAERAKIYAQVHKDWNDRLEAALKQKPADAKDFTLNQPKDEKDAVVLNASDVRELPFFQKLAERKEKMTGGEAVALEKALGQDFESSGEEAQPTSFREKAAEAREKMQAKGEAVKENIKEKTTEIREKVGSATPEDKAAAKEKIIEKREVIKERRADARERIMAGREKLSGERLSLNELKKGDKVLVGYDKDSMDYYTIIRHDVEAKPQPVSSEKKEPATVK